MNINDLVDTLRPNPAAATLVVAPEGQGSGYWAGAPSACVHGGRTYLAYRLRRPVNEGRGHSVVVAASDDGEHFDTILTLGKEPFGAASLERPSLVKGPDDQWILYVSCATPGTYHWWVDAIAATDPASFDPYQRRTVMAGDASIAVKDPVVIFDRGQWLMWPCIHPLDDPTATDRMWSGFARSTDGFDWSIEGGELRGRAGGWDGRGARVAWVLRDGEGWAAFYDGRATAVQNAEEQTGLATGPDPGQLEAAAGGPIYRSPWGTGSLRYMSVVDDPATGGRRIFYEACLDDGSHGLFSETR